MPVIINRAFIYILFTNLFLLALVHLSPLVYPGFWEFLEKMSVFLRRNFAVLFVLFFILAFLPKFLNTFLQRLLVGICFVLAIVNTFLFLQFDSFLNAAFVEVLFLTRVAEINEFFSSYLTMTTGGGDCSFYNHFCFNL